MYMIILFSTFIAFTFLISLLIFNMNKFLSMVKMMNIEKKIPFECGFNPISKFSVPFSMPFFTVSLLFLIFDIEITMMIPMIFYMNFSGFLSALMIIMLFLISMALTLIAEWFMGYLSWMF